MDEVAASSRPSGALYSDKAPYLVTLFVGALAWLVSYTVARYEKVPVIVYSVAAPTPSAAASGVTNFAATFTNISPAQAIDCAAIQLKAVGTTAGSDPPLAKGKVTLLTNSIVRHTLDEEAGAVVLQVFSMQPEAAIRVQASAAGTNSLRVFTAPCVSARGEQKPGLLPILKEESLETLVLQRSLLLLWSGAMAWAVALTILYGLSRWRRRTSSPSSGNGTVTSPVQPGHEKLATAPTAPSEGAPQ